MRLISRLIVEAGVTQLFALEQLLRNVRVTGGRDEGREPVHAGHDAIAHGVGRYFVRPAHDRRSPEATFHHRAFAHGKRGRTAVRPGEVLRAVVGGEHHNNVVIHAFFLQLGEHVTDDIVVLRHAGFLFRPSISRVAQFFILVGKVGNKLHARRVEPEEKRLLSCLALSQISSSTGLASYLLC